ncbi:MAG: transcription antitermination factor NusB [Lachnospiraceae bacterium]|nr:transcription antitermination factor NusB [Lachnospiraceae bacterium]
MNRRQLRDYTFKLLFHVTFYENGELEEQLETYLNECMFPEEGQLLLIESEKEELKTRFHAIVEKLPQINERIGQSSEGWKPERMNRVDLSILRLACYEMDYDAEVPQKVAINEAVELAKKYGGDESPRFVNGILSKLVRAEETPYLTE